MKRKETLELLIKIQEAIQYFEKEIRKAKRSNNFGFGLEFVSVREKNTQNIVTYTMCIGRLNERFTKQLNKLK